MILVRRNWPWALSITFVINLLITYPGKRIQIILNIYIYFLSNSNTYFSHQFNIVISDNYKKIKIAKQQT